MIYLNLSYLALQNLKRRPFRTYTLLLAVAIVSGALFSTAIMMKGVENSLETGFSKFGADILVVPKDSLISMKSALLTGEPSAFYMDESIIKEVASLEGVAKVSPQVFLVTAEGGCCTLGNSFIIGFDPATDFTITPWIEEKLDRPFGRDDVILGGLNPYSIGEKIFFYGQVFTVYGKLSRVGIGLYDNAYFIRMEKAYEMSEESKKRPDVIDLNVPRGKISTVLVRLGVGAKPDVVSFSISKNPDIKIVTAGTVITSLRQNLRVLFSNTIFLIAILFIGNALMIGAIFSTIINERRRELGLLRAIGATKNSIFRLVIFESAILTGIGGMLGIIIGGALLRIYYRTIIFNLQSLGMPFAWPPITSIASSALLCIGLSVILGIVGAFYPAFAGSKMQPYDSIRAGE